MNSEKILDISWGTIFKIFIVVLSIYILYQVRDILILFIFALIISILFTPIINFLTKHKIPRIFAVSFVYLSVFGIISLSIYLTIHYFFEETRQFFQILPYYFNRITPLLRELGVEALKGFEDFVALFQRTLGEMAATIFGALFVVFGGIFNTIFVLTIAFFLSLEERWMEKALSILFPKKYEDYVLSLWLRCQSKVNSWFFSRIMGCLFVGVAFYLVLLFFNVKYPLSLSLLAAILNFIPFIGPIITGAIIFIIIALTNIFQAIFVLIVFILIQQVENSILTPVLTKRFIGLSPVLVLLSLAIGGMLWGFLGAILAIPLAGILFEFLKEFLQTKKEREKAVIL